MRSHTEMSESCPLSVLSLLSLEQLGFNALLQLMIGVPLEMVHGILRISLLYMAGVLAGECLLKICVLSLYKLVVPKVGTEVVNFLYIFDNVSPHKKMMIFTLTTQKLFLQ